MKMMRNGEVAIIGVDGIHLMGEVEIGDNSPGWVTIGAIGGDSYIMIDESEWDAFKALIKEMDDVVQNRYPDVESPASTLNCHHP